MPIVLLGATLATTYFAYHAVYGTHGLITKASLAERLERVQRDTALLEAVRRRLTDDVSALATEPPHPDAVTEIARSTLGLVSPGDRLLVPPHR